MQPEREGRPGDDTGTAQISAATKIRTSLLGPCSDRWHGELPLCPLHGCAECCAQYFAYGVEDIDEPPVAPPYGADGCVVDDLAGDHHQGFVDIDGCAICAEIISRSVPVAIVHEISCDTHCVECNACPRATRICRKCQRCPRHAIGHCEDVVERWNKALRRVESIWYEEHDWWKAA